jgi:hypothetical protein
MRHCDDYIDDEGAPQCLRQFLSRARSPAHGLTSAEPFPALFADHPTLGRVRVVMASRFGDVGVTTKLHREIGHETRCSVEQLQNFSEQPQEGSE